MGKKKQNAEEIRDVWQPPFPPTLEESARWREEFEDALKRAHSTSGHKKLLAYFTEIVKTDFIQSRASRVRAAFSCPPSGLSKKDGDETLSSAWKEVQDSDKLVLLNKIIREICKKFSLHYMDWKDAVHYYLFTGKVELLINYLGAYNLFDVCDLVEEKIEPFGKDYQESDDMAFPIAIRISPYASLRDLIDFARKAYKTQILPRQMLYRDKNVSIGRIRPKQKKIQSRNDFIYENRHLSRKKIKRLVEEKFGEPLEYTHVAKIISLENKKRQKA
mgnify:CR=1 FL=1